VVPARARRSSPLDCGHLRLHRRRDAGVLRFGDSGGSTPWDVFDSAGGLPLLTPDVLTGWYPAFAGGPSAPGRRVSIFFAAWDRALAISRSRGVDPLASAVQSTTSGGVNPLCVVDVVNSVPRALRSPFEPTNAKALCAEGRPVDRAFLVLRVGRVEIGGKNNHEGGRYDGDGRREKEGSVAILPSCRLHIWNPEDGKDSGVAKHLTTLLRSSSIAGFSVN
jgi:hypothetical protein